MYLHAQTNFFRHRFYVFHFKLSRSSAVSPTQARRFVMLSNQPFQPNQSQISQWMQSLQAKIQGWIRTEIIDEDPCDEDQFTAQKLYEEFQALEKLTKVQPYMLPQRSSSY